MTIDNKLLRKIVEGALLASGGPLTVNKIASLFDLPEGAEPDPEFDGQEKPGKDDILAVLQDIQADCKERGYELKEVGSGWRFQVVQETAHWVNRLWEEKPQRYSRALLETLALIAYRQPITRGDIESIRGVAVSSTIIKTLTEREWVKVVGHRDVPGRPALYATTRQFLDYFNLKSLDELPSLREIQDFDKLDSELDLNALAAGAAQSEGEAGEPTDSEAAEVQSDKDSVPAGIDTVASAEAGVPEAEPQDEETSEHSLDAGENVDERQDFADEQDVAGSEDFMDAQDSADAQYSADESTDAYERTEADALAQDDESHS